MARQHTFMLPCLATYLQKGSMADSFPKLKGVDAPIFFKLESHASLTSVCLRNAQLSHRGSIRKAHDAITWVSKLLLLQSNGVTDPSAVIKQYNNNASSGGQIGGAKRVAILALLHTPKPALEILMYTQSTLATESPWHDDTWANKKIMPGWVWKSSVPGWNKRLTVTNDSFTLMVQWQSNVQKTRLPQLRRKYDKAAMEE
eukprot:8899265-Karenia_brevis.AAC.1